LSRRPESWLPISGRNDRAVYARSAAMTEEDRFVWHPDAALVGTDGKRAEGPAASAPAMIADRPAVEALRQALAASAAGVTFRIGGQGDDPAPASKPMFETLTSGSTGTPRRIRRSHASWIASFRVNAALFGLGPGMRVGVAGGLVHSIALYAALEALHLGAEAHLLDGLRPDRQVERLRASKVGLIYATPVQLRLMAETGAAPLPGVTRVITGGARLDPATAAALAALCPAAQVTEFYGAAETSFVSLTDATTPEDSVGRPYPGVEIDLRGNVLYVRSPYLAEGYAVPVPGGAEWSDGWVSVGEIGRIEGGNLFLSGRAGRMVTVADRNVFPEEIEAFLLSLPGVTRAAVLPRPDARRGHVIEAVVTGGETDAILRACRARLGPEITPRRLHRVADWPVMASGKTDLAALARLIDGATG
jgi:long-chain acyl-CoA synthetase